MNFGVPYNMGNFYICQTVSFSKRTLFDGVCCMDFNMVFSVTNTLKTTSFDNKEGYNINIRTRLKQGVGGSIKALPGSSVGPVAGC
jgi:hypothetical protein